MIEKERRQKSKNLLIKLYTLILALSRIIFKYNNLINLIGIPRWILYVIMLKNNINRVKSVALLKREDLSGIKLMEYQH